jgi:predicted dehydrogenase
LTAVVDVDEEFVKNTATELGVSCFTDYRALIDARIVDAVSIALPHHLHYEVGLASLNAGLHVCMEKPLAARVSEADKMVATANEKNLKLCVCHQYRTHRSSQVVKELIDEGTIGNISRVLWSWVDFRPESYYNRDIWRSSWRHAGGGVLVNQASHDIDLICWLVGKPVQVSALIANQLHKAEIEDIAAVNILFGNGAVATFQGSINEPRGSNIRQIAGDKGIIVFKDVRSVGYDDDDRILLGTYAGSTPAMAAKLKGIHDQPDIHWKKCRLPSTKNTTVIKRVARKLDKVILQRLMNSETPLQRSSWLKWSKPVGHYALLRSFVDSILDGEELVVTGESTIPSLELINGIILSALRKKIVDLPLDRAEYDQLFRELESGEAHVPRFR